MGCSAASNSCTAGQPPSGRAMASSRDVASSSASAASSCNSRIGVVIQWPRRNSSSSKSAATGAGRATGADSSQASSFMNAAGRINRCGSPRAHIDAGHAARIGGCLFSEPRREGFGKQRCCRPAFPSGAVRPVGRRLAEHLRHVAKKRRYRVEPPAGGAQTLVQRREVASDEAEHAENGFAGPQRRVGVHEVPALVLGQCDFERAISQRQIHLLRKRASPRRPVPAPRSRDRGGARAFRQRPARGRRPTNRASGCRARGAP